MVVELRIYKRYDTDLVALVDAGYDIKKMMKEALIGYATGMPVYFYIDEAIPFDEKNKKSVHTRFSVPDSDLKTCYLLRHIKPGYRNSFCKNLLRDCLVMQNLGGYFNDNSLFALQQQSLINKRQFMMNIAKPASEYKKKKSYVFMGKEISENKEAIAEINPFASMPQMTFAPPENNLNAFITQPTIQTTHHTETKQVTTPTFNPSPATVVENKISTQSEIKQEPVLKLEDDISPSDNASTSDDDLMAMFDNI